MKERIRVLAEKTLRGEMWVDPVPTKYDREDLFLSPVMMSAKRVSEGRFGRLHGAFQTRH